MARKQKRKGGAARAKVRPPLPTAPLATGSAASAQPPRGGRVGGDQALVRSVEMSLGGSVQVRGKGRNRIVLEAGNLTPRSTLRSLAETESCLAAMPCYLDSADALSSLVESAARQRGAASAPRWGLHLPAWSDVRRVLPNSNFARHPKTVLDSDLRQGLKWPRFGRAPRRASGAR